MIDIKKLRKLKGLTQKELAERCNVTLRTVQNWEQGKHIPESILILLELPEAKSFRLSLRATVLAFRLRRVVG